MRLVPLAPLLCLAVTACSIDNELGKDGVANDPFDTSSDWEAPGETDDTDREDTSPEEPDECLDPDLSRIAVTTDETCEVEATVGTFTPVIKWSNDSIGGAYTTPAVGQLTDDDGDGDVDEDDIPDAVVGLTSGNYVAVSGDDGHTLWTSSANLGSEPMSAAIGDLDGDGWPEVVGSGPSGTVAWHGEDGSVLWSTRAYSGGNSPQCGAVAIHDLDGDGNPEVIIGNWILNGADGSSRGQGSYGSGASHSWAAPIGAAADIDLDGELEVVVGNALYDADGNTIWYNGESDGAVAVANFDSDPEGEIVVTREGTVRLQDDDGSVIWERRNVAGSTVGTPTVADFDGDGEPEVGIAGNGTYIVLETDGTTKWQNTTKDYSSGFTGSSVFDFEGDGKAEVVYADEDNVFVYDGETGAVKLQETTHSSATCSEYPAVVDIDNDGHAEIVYTSSAYSGPENGIRAIGDKDNSWRKGTLAWNQHAFNITNVNDDASIPRYPDVNWETYNNYRSGDLSAGTGGTLPDAVVSITETCNTECEAGDLRLVVVVGNAGMGDLPAGVAVSMYTYQFGVAVFESTQYTPDIITPGNSSYGLEFHVDPANVVDTLIEFRVDDANGISAIEECHEDNNTDEVMDGLCP